MRAVVCSEFGGVQNLTLHAVDPPVPAAGEIAIQVVAAAVNLADHLMVAGKYQSTPPLPFTPGFEVAGKVVAIGPEVERFRPGDRVLALTRNGYGGYAEQALAHQSRVVALPDAVDFVAGAALFSPYGTSFHALVQRAQLVRGETLVVLGAAGSIGQAAIVLGKALGARVVAVVSNVAKQEIARRRGADVVIDIGTEDLRTRVLEVTAGQGADVCVDPVGGELFATMSRCMNWNGRLLTLGFASGQVPSLPVNLPLLKCYQLVGVFWDAYVARFPAQNRDNFQRIWSAIPEVARVTEADRVFPLDRFAQALAAAADRGQTGRVVLSV